MESKNTFSNIVMTIMFKKDMDGTQLAKLLGCSPSNVSKKLRLNNFRESDIRQISKVLGYDVSIKLTSKDTGEELRML